MTNEEIIQRGILIRDETEPAQNTSERVGGVIEGIGRNLADKDTAIAAEAARNGYYQCTVSGTTLAVTAPGFTLPAHGGNIRIKMSAPATGASTLNINGTDDKALLYNGAAVSSANTWEKDEIISVFYDGTKYMASNSQGGGGNASKIKYDNSQSGLSAENVQGGLDELSQEMKISEYIDARWNPINESQVNHTNDCLITVGNFFINAKTLRKLSQDYYVAITCNGLTSGTYKIEFDYSATTDYVIQFRDSSNWLVGIPLTSGSGSISEIVEFSTSPINFAIIVFAKTAANNTLSIANIKIHKQTDTEVKDIVKDLSLEANGTDLDIADNSSNVLNRFFAGHIKTEKFDSVKTLSNIGVDIFDEFSTSKDYAINDIVIYCGLLFQFISSHSAGSWNETEVKRVNITKADSPFGIGSDSSADLDIVDDNGNVIARFVGGHLITKNFDSRYAGSGNSYEKLRFCNWNIAHFNLGDNIINRIDTEEEYNTYLPVYRGIFNEVNADFISLCEFESPFWKDHPDYTAKRELFPNYKYYKDNATATSKGNWVAFFSHLPLYNVTEVPFTDYPSGAYRYYLVGDMIVSGKNVKVVCTHLTHDTSGSGGSNAYAPLQIAQLISDFQDYQNVVMLADWNTGPAGFQPFKDAGYTMANNDYLGTLQTAWDGAVYYEGAMDNIVVKGGSINNINVIDVNDRGVGTLSDHYLIYCDIVFE